VGVQIMLRLLKSFFFDRNFRENRLFRYTVRQFFLNISSHYGSIVASPPIGEAGFSKTARIRPLTGLVQSCQYIQNIPIKFLCLNKFGKLSWISSRKINGASFPETFG
jgi:hypothetical protein